jgi:hypothetical protein
MLLLSVQDHGSAFSGASYRERGVSSGATGRAVSLKGDPGISSGIEAVAR